MTTLTTTCRCGAVQLTMSGEPVVQLYCHCDDCRAAHGGAYVAAANRAQNTIKDFPQSPATDIPSDIPFGDPP